MASVYQRSFSHSDAATVSSAADAMPKPSEEFCIAVSLKIYNQRLSANEPNLPQFFRTNPEKTREAVQNALFQRTTESGIKDPNVQEIGFLAYEVSIWVHAWCSSKTHAHLLEDFDSGNLRFQLEKDFRKVDFFPKLGVVLLSRGYQTTTVANYSKPVLRRRTFSPGGKRTAQMSVENSRINSSKVNEEHVEVKTEEETNSKEKGGLNDDVDEIFHFLKDKFDRNWNTLLKLLGLPDVDIRELWLQCCLGETFQRFQACVYQGLVLWRKKNRVNDESMLLALAWALCDESIKRNDLCEELHRRWPKLVPSILVEEEESFSPWSPRSVTKLSRSFSDPGDCSAALSRQAEKDDSENKVQKNEDQKDGEKIDQKLVETGMAIQKQLEELGNTSFAALSVDDKTYELMKMTTGTESNSNEMRDSNRRAHISLDLPKSPDGNKYRVSIHLESNPNNPPT